MPVKCYGFGMQRSFNFWKKKDPQMLKEEKKSHKVDHSFKLLKVDAVAETSCFGKLTAGVVRKTSSCVFFIFALS